jgi:hypothetical protein
MKIETSLRVDDNMIKEPKIEDIKQSRVKKSNQVLEIKWIMDESSIAS